MGQRAYLLWDPIQSGAWSATNHDWWGSEACHGLWE